MVLILYIMRLAEKNGLLSIQNLVNCMRFIFARLITQHYSSLTWVFKFLYKSCCLNSNANVGAAVSRCQIHNFYFFIPIV